MGHSLLVYIYLDDILILSPDPTWLDGIGHGLHTHLTHNNLVVSPKSSLTPSQHITWLGKTFNLAAGTIRPTHNCTLRTVATVILAALVPVHDKLSARIAGILLWANRPMLGSTLFLAGLYHHQWARKTRFAHFLSNNCWRALADLLAISIVGWHARPIPTAAETIFVDAAGSPSAGYQVGLFHHTAGFQVHRAPMALRSQQEGEAYGLEYALRIAIRVTPHAVAIVGDNKGQLLNLISLTPRVSNHTFVRIYR